MTINNLHPGLIMMAFGLIIMAAPKAWRKALTIAAPLAATFAFLNLDMGSNLKYRITDNMTLDIMSVDRLSMVFLAVFCLIAILNAVYAIELQDRREAGMSALYVGSVMSIVMAGDSISFIVFWEISALASMYLVYAKHCRKSSRAAFRYILMHAFGGNMLLVGVLLHIYHYGMAFTNIADTYDASFWLILIGVGVNAAIPPLNGWLPDAYPEATLPGTVYLGSFTTKAAIYALIRFFAGTEMLIWIGAFMAVYAACMAIMENDLRRLLSYHIISQLGMMVASLAVGSQMGIDGASAHATTNIMFKGVLLMGAGAVIYATGKSKISELGGLAKKMPVTAICFLISSLSIAGLPFLSGFASKALIMESLTEGGYVVPELLLTAAGVGTLLSITLKINYFVFFGKSDLDLEVRKVPISMQIAMIGGTIFSIVMGIDPDLLYNYMTYQTVVDPFSLPHILEYVAIFIGGSVPFIIFIKKMKPHDEISIDFDWFYRRPLAKIVDLISRGVYAFFAWCDRWSLGGVHYLGSHFGDPYMWTRNSSIVRIKSMSFENEDRLIGDVIEEAVGAMVVMVIIAAALIHG